MIFLVEDNAAIRETIVAYLQLDGLEVREFPLLSGVIEAAAFRLPELVILDVMLPDGNGFALAQKLRRLHPALPFIFLTARESESDRITGLELGAEDYVVKPFSPRELVLRVQAILRRCADCSQKVPPALRTWWLEGHSLAMDSRRHELSIDGSALKLTGTEWNILAYLAGSAGQVVPRERILGECLDYLHDGSERTVNTHIKNLRAKLTGPGWIETVRGFGYKFMGRL